MKPFKLDSEPKIKSGFNVPDAYFDGFSEKIMQQLPQENPKVISLWAKNKKWLFATAAILVLSVSIPLMNVLQNNTNENYQTEIENYITYQSSVSDDEIADLLEIEDLNKIDVGNSIENQTLEEELLNESNLEQYITN